jgi:hypothetical protein
VNGLSRRLAVLFLLALFGVLVVGGIVAAELGGLPLLLGYVAVTAVLVGVGAARGRRLTAARAAPPVHCSCCDGDHTAPVRVV